MEEVYKTKGIAHCHLPEVREREFDANVSLERAQLIRVISKKWVNGTKLRYSFFKSGPDASNDAQMNVVRDAFAIWKNVGIGLDFEEVNNLEDAEIRIGFRQGDGAWSYVGRDVLRQGASERTMNFGWDLTRAGEADTAPHEVGHTLGFPHEHQNPNAGIVWNEEAVYEELGGWPNFWPREQTHWNIIRKISPDSVDGSDWDPDSIMHYPFGPGLIKEPVTYSNGLTPAAGLSEKDKAQVKFFYPPLEPGYPQLKPFRSEDISIAPGEQVNFEITPDTTRTYTIGTFGFSDTVMVLFEDYQGDLVYVTGDDDSGTDLNARLKVRLYKGRRYVLRLRLYYKYASGESSVMMW